MVWCGVAQQQPPPPQQLFLATRVAASTTSATTTTPPTPSRGAVSRAVSTATSAGMSASRPSCASGAPEVRVCVFLYVCSCVSVCLYVCFCVFVGFSFSVYLSSRVSMKRWFLTLILIISLTSLKHHHHHNATSQPLHNLHRRLELEEVLRHWLREVSGPSQSAQPQCRHFFCCGTVH